MPAIEPVKVMKVIQPLCFEHHAEMRREQLASHREEVVYSCQEPECHIHYCGSEGYFFNPTGEDLIDQYGIPRLHCAHDGSPLFLLEVQPENHSFRLWRCPKCNMSRVSGMIH